MVLCGENLSRVFSFFVSSVPLQATDPEGDRVSYYAYSMDIQAAAAGVGREVHQVTQDGVVSVSVMALPTGKADGTASAPSAAGDPNGGGSTADGAAGPAGQLLPKDIFIVAMDDKGAHSILQGRFYLACGEVVV